MELYNSVKNNNLSEVQRLLETENININYQNDKESGWTALHLSCKHGLTDIARVLLQHRNINVDSVNVFGNSPFLIACSNGRTETVKLLIQDSRVDVNKMNNDTHTPLMYSCYWGHLLTVQELIKCAKVDLFVKSTKDITYDDATYKLGSTALDVAKQKGRTEIVKVLEEEMNRRKQGKLFEGKKKKERKKIIRTEIL